MNETTTLSQRQKELKDKLKEFKENKSKSASSNTPSVNAANGNGGAAGLLKKSILKKSTTGPASSLSLHQTTTASASASANASLTRAGKLSALKATKEGSIKPSTIIGGRKQLTIPRTPILTGLKKDVTTMKSTSTSTSTVTAPVPVLVKKSEKKGVLLPTSTKSTSSITTKSTTAQLPPVTRSSHHLKVSAASSLSKPKTAAAAAAAESSGKITSKPAKLKVTKTTKSATVTTKKPTLPSAAVEPPSTVATAENIITPPSTLPQHIVQSTTKEILVMEIDKKEVTPLLSLDNVKKIAAAVIAASAQSSSSAPSTPRQKDGRLVILEGTDNLREAKQLTKNLFNALENGIAYSAPPTSSSFPSFIKEFLEPGLTYGVSKSLVDNLDFWLAYAQFEELSSDGDANIGVAEIFERAGESLTEKKDLELLRQESQLALLRMSRSTLFDDDLLFPKQEVDDESDDRQQDIPISKYLEHTDPSQEYYEEESRVWGHAAVTEEDEDDEDMFASIPKHELYVKEEPMGRTTKDLVSMLANLDLCSSMGGDKFTAEHDTVKVKKEALNLLDDLSALSPPKKTTNHFERVGVPVAEDASLITVLTPIRASRKLKMELGVNHVITPVRRSLRFHDEQDYVTKSVNKKSTGSALSENNENSTPPYQQTGGAAKKEKVLELLQDHDMAFVPNENMNFKMNGLL